MEGFREAKEEGANCCILEVNLRIRTYSNCLLGHDLTIETSDTKTIFVLKSEHALSTTAQRYLVGPNQTHAGHKTQAKRREENGHK